MNLVIRCPSYPNSLYYMDGCTGIDLAEIVLVHLFVYVITQRHVSVIPRANYSNPLISLLKGEVYELNR